MLSGAEASVALDDGTRIAVKIWGADEVTAKTRILACHGWLDNANTWDGLAPLIVRSAPADQPVRLVAMDFAGHGHSSHLSKDAHYTLVNHALNVNSVADALRWDKFVLFGHSMGAAISLLFASAMRHRVEKLVLVDGVGPWPTLFSAPKNLELGIRSRVKALHRRRRTYSTVDEMQRRYLKNNPVMLPSSARKLLERGVEQVELAAETQSDHVAVETEAASKDDEDEDEDDTEDAAGESQGRRDDDEGRVGSVEIGYSFRHDPRLVSWSMQRMTEQQSLDCCRRLKCPVLLFLADNEVRRKEPGMAWMKPTFAQRIANIKDVTVITVEGSHHLHLDQPLTIYKAVLNFLVDPSLNSERRVLDELPPHPMPNRELRALHYQKSLEKKKKRKKRKSKL